MTQLSPKQPAPNPADENNQGIEAVITGTEITNSRDEAKVIAINKQQPSNITHHSLSINHQSSITKHQMINRQASIIAHR